MKAIKLWKAFFVDLQEYKKVLKFNHYKKQHTKQQQKTLNYYQHQIG